MSKLLPIKSGMNISQCRLYVIIWARLNKELERAQKNIDPCKTYLPS